MAVVTRRGDHARHANTNALRRYGNRAAFVTIQYGHATAWLKLMHESLAAHDAFNKLAELRAICDRELAELCQNYPEISLAVVATADARLISMRSSIVQDGHRIAAMTGSLLALCESLARELSAGGCQSTVVSMDHYTCIIVRIADPHHPLALAIGVGHNIMLALSRRVALDLASRISSHIQRMA
jgi:predicted regulator of Ras-like GTPase activity (Roadblock/LC7/MglB family)